VVGSAPVNDLVRFALVAFFPREGDLPGLAELGVDEHVAGLRRDATPLFWIGVVGAALFFQLSPILTVRRPWPAVFLSEEQLDAHAHRLATHPVYLIRQVVMLLKLIGGFFWGQSKEIRATLALPPYGDDPGTRRTEALVGRAAIGGRAPVALLVQIGRRDEAKGRGREHGRAHALDVEAEAAAAPEGPRKQAHGARASRPEVA
jgi:hypothetical protein